MVDFYCQIKSFFHFFYKMGVTFLSFKEYISECVFIKFNELIYITMKRVQGQSTENTFGFEVLSNEEMIQLRGGEETKPKSRDRDVFDLEEE